MPTPIAGEYWLIHPTDSNLNVRLSNVITDEYTDEWEEATHNIINAGRKKDYGQRWGIRGSLTAQVWDEPGRTAREAKIQLEALKAAKTHVTLQTPFGDNYTVSMGSIRISRTPGAGPREFHDLTLEYEELYTASP